MRAFSDRLDRAIALAARAHRDQTRKGSDVPYVQHPVHVAIILYKHGFSEDVAIAGVLHDVVEDTSVTLAEIADEFGDDVAKLVDVVTETKLERDVKRPWRVRKDEQLAKLATASFEAAAIKAADSLHNCASTIRDVRAHGAAAWARYNAPREDQLWWCRSVARVVRERMGDHPLARELDDVVSDLAIA